MKTSVLSDAVETNSAGAHGLVARVARLKAAADSGACTTAVTPLIDAVMSQARALEAQIAEQHARIRYLEGLSVTDEVTGLFNRRGFDAEFERTLARARRNGEQGLLVLCDLDRFKAINDTYGHMAGDAVLQGVGALLRTAVRASDVVARLGGDEFGVILVDADPAAGGRVDPLRARLNGLFIAHGETRIPVSCSLGYAAYGPASDAETAMALADKALYRSKST